MELNGLMGGGIGVELDDGTTQWTPTTAQATPPAFKRIYLSAINMTTDLTEVINIKIPDGKKAVLLAASISISTASGNKVQLEMDGVLRVNETNQSQQPGTGIALVGTGVDSSLNFLTGSDGLGRPANISNLVFRDRLIIRAFNAAATSGAVAVTYILVKG
jgi:hypothetical protein